MSNELKPCPFCGGEVYHGEYSAYSCDSSFDAIVCDECGVYFDSQDESNKDAADRWNARAESAELERAIKSLKAAGFMDCGGELWKPPVNKDNGKLIRQRLILEDERTELLSLLLDARKALECCYEIQALEDDDLDPSAQRLMIDKINLTFDRFNRTIT